MKRMLSPRTYWWDGRDRAVLAQTRHLHDPLDDSLDANCVSSSVPTMRSRTIPRKQTVFAPTSGEAGDRQCPCVRVVAERGSYWSLECEPDPGSPKGAFRC